jgi:hypothetical protein
MRLHGNTNIQQSTGDSNQTMRISGRMEHRNKACRIHTLRNAERVTNRQNLHVHRPEQKEN